MTISKQAVLRFGIPSLDKLVGQPQVSSLPSSEMPYGLGVVNPTNSEIDAVSICITGGDGVGKSMLAMHLASAYRADQSVENIKQPSVIYASTDLTFGRAVTSWKNFALDMPFHRIEDPFDLLERPAKAESIGEAEQATGKIELTNYNPLDRDTRLPIDVEQCVFTKGQPLVPVVFLDMATHTTGDDWAFVNRLVASLPTPQTTEPKHLLIIDAVEGLEVLVGEVDAYGQKRDRRSRVAQLLRTAARKCHLLFLVETRTDSIRTPEEYVADAVIRFSTYEDHGYIRRMISVDKARGQSHTRGDHEITIRSGKGSSTGGRDNPDDPRVIHPEQRSRPDYLPALYFDSDANQRKFSTGYKKFDFLGSPKDLTRYQAYAFVTPSLNAVSREVMQQKGGKIASEGGDPLAGFGVKHLDDLLQSQRNPAAPGDHRGFPASEPVALIGEDATYKSRLAKAFLAQACHEAVKEPGVAILLTTKTLEEDGLKARLEDHVPSGGDASRILGINVLCRRLEVHYVSPATLFHIVKQMVRRAQAALTFVLDQRGRKECWQTDEEHRRKQGYRIRLVIDNWATIREMCPQIRDDPLILPCLLFFLRREGIATVFVANENEGFTTNFKLESTRRLRDLTSIQLFTWRVSYFGEQRVALTVTPAMHEYGKGSVVRELRLLNLHPERGSHVMAGDSERIAVNPSFELFDGLMEGNPEYVRLKVYLYETSEGARKYIEETSFLFNQLLNAKESERVLNRIEPQDYEQWREFAELQGVSRFPYTLVMQVDEFWAKSNSLQFRSQRNYLEAIVAAQSYIWNSKKGELERGKYHEYITEDPFRLCQPSIAQLENREDEQNPQLSEKFRAQSHDDDSHKNPIRVDWSRHEMFDSTGYSLSKLIDKRGKNTIKVPYTWDFGFLMLNRDAWNLAAAKNQHVRAVFDRLHILDGSNRSGGQVDWGEFVEACQRVASIRQSISPENLEYEYVPFSIAPEVQETVSCLFLELWGSFIDGSDPSIFVDCRDKDESRLDLSELFDRFKEEAKSAIEHLARLIPAKLISDDNRVENPIDGKHIPIAIRCWYSAAAALQETIANDIYVPCALPGTRRVRGDWFLCTARGSRSYQMGERATDILCSRRANIVRLQQGVGLPVREIERKQAKFLWTALWHFNDAKSRTERVTYQQLLSLGVGDNNKTGRWLWRSRIPHYDRHSRLLRRWLCSTLRQIHDIDDTDQWFSRHISDFRDSLQQATIPNLHQ